MAKRKIFDELMEGVKAMKNPQHPGGLVLRQCIEPLGLTIADAAAALGVTRTTLFRTGQREARDFSRDGGEIVQSLRRQRGRLAKGAGAVRYRPGSRRPHQTPPSCFGLAGFTAGHFSPLGFRIPTRSPMIPLPKTCASSYARQ
jgi:hypothetical protein